jgi:hypothetical protein
MRKWTSSVFGLLFLVTFVVLLYPSVAFALVPAIPSNETNLTLEPDLRVPCSVPTTAIDLPISAQTTLDSFPTLAEFAASVMNADARTVTGVYICRVLALRVVQQPANNPVYVSRDLGMATQFRLAADLGTIGLLAHNNRSGSLFFNLKTGHEVDVVYGDGTIRRYVISSLRHFQTLEPTNPYSTFRDLDLGGDLLSSTDVFRQMYAGYDQVVLQTCIAANGEQSWGRLFVIATPIVTSWEIGKNKWRSEMN